MKIFTQLLLCDLPSAVMCDPKTRRNKEFSVAITADGTIPFPQVIVRNGSQEVLVNGKNISSGKANTYCAVVAAGVLPAGTYSVQVEGCRTKELGSAAPADWIKWFGEVRIEEPTPAGDPGRVQIKRPQVCGNVKLYFGIHKHMHQPYYQAADPSYWDGQKDEIFGTRAGAYTGYIPGAVRQYISGGLAHAGLSTSWSGSLIEQLDRCERDGLCGGRFGGWKKELADLAQEKTALGNRRVEFSAFGFFHPLMPLMPARDIIAQIRRHRDVIKRVFGVEASSTLFPPETAFHVRMIPALLKAGISAVIYDSIHRFRACKEYPYAGMNEGMLPPNPAEQENPPVGDWMQLNNIWAGSKISPSLLRPEYVQYEDADGTISRIIAVPAERYIGNEDARGGFGALQYPDVLGQVYDNIVRNNTFDAKHPPFFVLHSDGDNYGGGADSYYFHNTSRLVEWIRNDPRFELTTIDDYLKQFPPDPKKAMHLEPGSWSGADNGDPQFRKWFSRYDEPYSPDLNSWAVLTALQNAVHTLEDAGVKNDALSQAQRLLLTAETSCYWYWTGQDEWDGQVTAAANAAIGLIKGDLDRIAATGKDVTGPAIFAPWITPENPGGKTWGQGCLKDAAKTGTVHTFVHDITGVRRVSLHLRTGGVETVVPMTGHGAYPSRTNPAVCAGYYTCGLPAGAGDVRYYVEAEDTKGNISRGALERVFLV